MYYVLFSSIFISFQRAASGGEQTEQRGSEGDQGEVGSVLCT